MVARPLMTASCPGSSRAEPRAATTPVAGYGPDLSPVKSVSASWAVAPIGVATTIKDAHDAAVVEVLAYLDSVVALTRCGTNGVAQVDTSGLIGAALTHCDSAPGRGSALTQLVRIAHGHRPVGTADPHQPIV
jgi:TrwC relaxase